MIGPLPWKLTGAEVRISGEIVSVSVHDQTIRTKLQPKIAKQIWAELGVGPDVVGLEIVGPAAVVELAWDGVSVLIGATRFVRPVPSRYWDLLQSREIEARKGREAAHAA